MVSFMSEIERIERNVLTLKYKIFKFDIYFNINKLNKNST